MPANLIPRGSLSRGWNIGGIASFFFLTGLGIDLYEGGAAGSHGSHDTDSKTLCDGFYLPLC
jgi:hypothetical protein